MSTAGALASGVLRVHIETITHQTRYIMGCIASCCRKQGANAIQAVGGTPQAEGLVKGQQRSAMRTPMSHPISYSSLARVTPPSQKQLNIVHFNDVYNVEARDTEPVGGAAKFVSKVKQLAKEENALVLFSGDVFNPSLMSTVTAGAQMPPVLNQAQVAAACVGNHDLDFGVDRFEELAKECKFPWLMANVLQKETADLFPQCKRYVIQDWQGVKLGIMGLVEREWLTTLPLIEVEDVIYVDYVEEARRLCKILREQEQVDLVVALTHMRVPNDMHLGAEVPELDLILGGHDHHYEVTASEPHGTLVVKSGTDFRELTLLQVTLGPDKPTITHSRVEITRDVPDDKDTALIVKSYTDKQEAMLAEEAGPVSTNLDGRFQVVRTMECNLGNLVVDIMRHSLDGVSERPLDCTLLNGGTMRSDMVHQSGMLTKRDLLSILPMMDEVAVVEITGKDLLRALEVGVSSYPKLEGRFLHVSNICFDFDGSRKAGDRVFADSVFVGNEPLDMDRLYNVGTKSYLLAGKDGFDCFSKSREVLSAEECPQLPTMINQHFETLKQVNEMLQAGEEITTSSSLPVKRLVQAAEQVEGNDCSAICRFLPQDNMYMADPAVEGRINRVKS